MNKQAKQKKNATKEMIHVKKFAHDTQNKKKKKDNAHSDIPSF